MNKDLRSIADHVLSAIRDPEVSRRLYIVTLAAALLILVLVIRGPEQRGTFITDGDGNVTGIRRHSLESSEQYDVRLAIYEAGITAEEELTLTLRAVTDGGERTGIDEAENAEALRDAEIDRLISEIEYSDEEIVALPSKLSDGAGLIWRANSSDDHTELLVIGAFYLILIVLIVKKALTGPVTEEAVIRKEIIRGLPRFCNQLFLMMNAGMILSDAFERICRSYSEFGKDRLSWFENAMTELSLSDDHRTTTADRLYRFAVTHNAKEMIRIATILTENEKRGSDVIESLSRESNYLWEDRKIIAREAGKMIDTRMTLPLALLLILLIVITMAPALLSM